MAEVSGMTGADLRAARKALGLTQLGLAQILGCQAAHVSRCENGHEPISVPIAGYVRAMQAFGLPETWP